MSQPPLTPAPPVTPAASFPALGRRPLPRWVGSAGLGLGQGALVLGLALFLALPLLAILIKSVTDGDGAWVGLSVMTGIIAGDGFLAMVGRSLAVGMVTTLLVVPAAYAFAYGLTRTRLPGKACCASRRCCRCWRRRCCPASRWCTCWATRACSRA